MKPALAFFVFAGGALLQAPGNAFAADCPGNTLRPVRMGELLPEESGGLDGIRLRPRGLVEWKSPRGSTVRIARVAPEQFPSLPKGTVLVDSRTHLPLMVGVHFFDLGRVDANGFLPYGFSERVKAQPFVRHRIFKTYDALTKYDRYDLPKVAKAYLTLKGPGTLAADIAGEVGTGASDQDAVKVPYIRIYWWFEHDPAVIADYRRLAATAGGIFDEVHQTVILTDAKQYNIFFGVLAFREGGLEAMIDRYNQKADPIGSLDWYSPGFAGQVARFFDKVRVP